jgi:hypothetical protein
MPTNAIVRISQTELRNEGIQEDPAEAVFPLAHHALT